MLNVIALMGRLVADPELRHTPNGIATCTFRIAVDRNFVRAGEERKADFIDIVAWRQSAEFVCKYFHKGNMIAVNGSLQTRNYEDKNGNKRTAYEVVADNIHFAESKASSGGYAGGYGAAPAAAPVNNGAQISLAAAQGGPDPVCPLAQLLQIRLHQGECLLPAAQPPARNDFFRQTLHRNASIL